MQEDQSNSTQGLSTRDALGTLWNEINQAVEQQELKSKKRRFVLQGECGETLSKNINISFIVLLIPFKIVIPLPHKYL